MEDAKAILARWSEMDGHRRAWDSKWQKISDFALPRKGNISRSETGPGTNAASKLFDTTAIRSVEVLANGHASFITPPGTRWFAWEAPDEIKSDEADAWYASASEKALKWLASGNFHTTLNEAFVERAGFGLCCHACMPHPTKVFSFQAHPVGTYCIDEDSEGNVDTIFRRADYGIRQLVQMFGEEAVVANGKLAKSWEAFKTKGTNAKHYVVHAVFPRLNREAGKRDVFNMRFASVWVAEEGKCVLQRSGFEELPYMVSRYLKRAGSGQQYGYSPFEQVEAEVYDANKTKQILQVVGQKLAVPPVLIPDNLVGNVDSRPGGKTVFRSGANAGELPREWQVKGNPQGMFDQLQDAREAIKAAYHTDLFRMFAEREKVMTAREVSELAGEKLMGFSPSFTLFTADNKVMMDRIFAIGLRSGRFGPPPPGVIRKTDEGDEVPSPKVVYQSRMALAIRQAESAAGDRLIERGLAIAELVPDALDNINMDEYLRTSGRNDGVAEKLIRPEKERDGIRKQRAAAQAEQAKMMQAIEGAKAAAAVGVKA